MSAKKLSLAYLQKPKKKGPYSEFSRNFEMRRRIRRMLAEEMAAPDWDEHSVLNVEYTRENYFYWFESPGVKGRGSDRPAEIYGVGDRFWLTGGELHREHAPAHIDVWGNGLWHWNGFPAAKEFNVLLNLIYDEANLTEKRADELLAFAEEYNSQVGRMASPFGAFANYERPHSVRWIMASRVNGDDVPTVMQWVTLVVARHRSPNLSDEYRTMLALKTLADL